MNGKLVIGACAALAAAALLSGCGKMGQLERPGPLNGASGATTRKADDAQAKAQDPSRPVNTIDPREESTDPSPPRTLPIPSSGSDPFGQPPQGALPNPYSSPR